MSKGSSPRGDTTKNTYTDLGATTDEAYRISASSRTLAREAIGDESREDRIRQRCSVAVGDFGMAGLLRFRHHPVEAGLAALEKKAPIIADIRMVQVGIQKKGHESPVLCALDYGGDLARTTGMTRSRAGVVSLDKTLDGSILVIGNAPSALLAVCELIREGAVHPALVIGTPVGFINAAESKEELRGLPVPSISNEGTRGGTPVAVAAMNEIITIHAEQDQG
jgi:precorrin-8X/cobalt-precorrin-8 methylmutase